jgi:hypothetical protein
MANIRKSFNFRNGVQVDNDNFIVNSNGLVGIGTSIPTESLDLIGNAKITGFTTTITLGVAQTANFYNDLKVGPVNIDPSSGVITATKFVGDASGLQNIFAISTTGWISQGVGLHTFRSIGIGTTNPVYNLQIGGDPATATGAGFDGGNILASGIVTATSFVGNLTGNVTGNVTGVAASATKLETARDFNITGDLESSTISFDGTGNVSLPSELSSSFSANTSGIVTASKFVGPTESTTSTITTGTITTGTITNANITNADVGIGTFDDLRINKSAAASLVVTSTTNSSVSIGESVGAGNSSAQLLYTPGTGRLDINNYDVGGVSINLHEGTGTGTTESFNVNYDNSTQFEVTYDGKVGVNRGGAALENNLEVGGDALITGNSQIVGILTVGTGSEQVTLGDGSPIPVSDSQNFNTLSGISTFNKLSVQDIQVGGGITVSSDVYVGNDVGIGTTTNVGFATGGINPKLQIFGVAYSTEGFISKQTLGITTNIDGSFQSDPRTIPSDLGSTIPFLSYGDFQVDSGAAGFISSNFLIVPTVGVATVGFGSTNLGIISKNHIPGGSESEYLSSVGVNTYFARSVFDVGTASTSMNSYFIPPSLTETQISVVSNLWQNPSGFGTVLSRKVTPNGLVPGGLVYNSSRDNIQIRNTASSFRNLSPVVAFGTIVSGAVPTPADGYNLDAPANSTNDANFSFSTALQSANYTVIVSNTGTSTFTVPEVNKTTAGFKITFSSSASTKSYSVMILQV